MKKTILLILLFPVFAALAQERVPIIFDTDIAPDYDDVGAMALLHAFADKGEANILATISCNAFETTVPTLSVLNTYFKRPNIPIGVVKADVPNRECQQLWAQAIIEKYPHSVKKNAEAEDAVVLYRKILARQPDHSVTIVSVGFFTNLANLLKSGPDQYSALSGRELVGKKVKQLVSMAASLEKDGREGHEFNVWVDAPAARTVFAEWPTRIVLSGFGIGVKILTGIRLIHNDNIKNSPVKDAFQVALTKDQNSLGRNSWDETAVLVAVRGIQPYFSSRKINLEIKDDGTSVLVPGEKFVWLEFSKTPEELSKIIEDLMMHQPK